MTNEGEEQVIQVAAFFRRAIEDLVGSQALPKELFSAFGDVMALGQSGPPVGELLPFDGIGSHDRSIRAEICAHGTNSLNGKASRPLRDDRWMVYGKISCG